MYRYMLQALCGHCQAAKIHKNQNYNCSISYGRSDLIKLRKSIKYIWHLIVNVVILVC